MFAWWSVFLGLYLLASLLRNLLFSWCLVHMLSSNFFDLITKFIFPIMFILRIRNIHWGLMYSDIYYKCNGIWWTALRGCLETYPHLYYAFWQMLGALVERNYLSAQYWSDPWPRTRSILSEILGATTRSRPPWTGISWLDSKLWLFILLFLFDLIQWYWLV